MTSAGNARSAIARSHPKIAELFGADLRSLAAFRVVLGLVALADLWTRVTNLTVHYADGGVLPRAALLEEVWPRWSFSLHMATGESFVLALLLLLQGAAAVALLIGYRPRRAALVVWALTISLHVRNPLVLSSADVLLRLLLFWAMFLPLGARWSVDALRGAAPRRLHPQFLSLGTVALFAQIVFMYVFTAILKSGPEWRTDHTALYYALTLKQFLAPVGAHLHQFSDLLRLLTFSTLVLEAFGPLLLFSPWLTGPLRTLGVLSFMGLHAGIGLTMSIGLFPWVAGLCMVCFLPAWFWDDLPRLVEHTLPRLGAAGTALRRRGEGLTAARPFVMQWVQAVARPAHAAGALTWTGGAGASAGGRRGAVDTASGPATPDGTRREDAADPLSGVRGGARGAAGAPVVLRSSRALNVAAAAFLALVFGWNLSTVSDASVPEPLEAVAASLRLNQKWSMFAPSPGKMSHWYSIPGTLANGQRVDLASVLRGDFAMRDGGTPVALSLDAAGFKDHRWEKYMSAMGKEEYRSLRLHLGRYICREWNGRHEGGARVHRFRIISMSETALPDYRRPETKERQLWAHRCW